MARELLEIYKINRRRSTPDTYEKPSLQYLPDNHWNLVGPDIILYTYYDDSGALLDETLVFSKVHPGVGKVGGVPDRSGTWYISLPLLPEERESVGAPFIFYVNPTRIEISASKAKTRIRTRRGYEFQHWGNEPTDISVTGRTGGLGQYDFMGNKKYHGDIQKSTAYKVLTALKKLYDEDQGFKANNQASPFILGLTYRGKVYIGHFDTFSFTEDAEVPYIFDYSFKFTAEFESKSLISAQQSLSERDLSESGTLSQVQGAIVRRP